MKIFKGNLNCKSARAQSKPLSQIFPQVLDQKSKKSKHTLKEHTKCSSERALAAIDTRNHDLPARAKDSSNSLFFQKMSEPTCSAHYTRKS